MSNEQDDVFLTLAGASFIVAAPVAASAQDVAITNARIVVGTGQVIDSGTIVVRGGTIDGDPTANIYEMLETRVVLEEGSVVVDKRQ